jgi:hypothetical protein
MRANHNHRIMAIVLPFFEYQDPERQNLPLACKPA